MKLAILFVFATAVVACAGDLPALHQVVPTLGGPEPNASRICTKSGEKCAGAVGFPEVVYKACCDTALVCATPVPEIVPKGEWGAFCIRANQVAPAVVTVFPPSSTSTTTSSAILSNSSSTTEDDGSVCFPGHALVQLEDGSRVRMDSIAVGDSVRVGMNMFSKVFMFTHKLASVEHEFVTLQTDSGSQISLTRNHYVYANGALVSASEVRLGDSLVLESGITDAVVGVSKGRHRGLYNPQTLHGDIVVDGILASTYTTSVDAVLAHSILAPLRFLSVFGINMPFLENGGDSLRTILPRGELSF